MSFPRLVRWSVAAAALVASAVASSRGLPAWEDRLYRRINNAPELPAPLVWAPMQAGSLSAPFALAGVTRLRTRRADPAVAEAAAGFAAWLTAKGMKRIVGRGRPYDFDRGTHLRLGIPTDGSLGFVSGHAAVASTLATIAGTGRPGWQRLLLLGAGAAVGVTRIYAGAHLPLDVVGGVALGVIIGESANEIRDRFLPSL